MGRAIEEQEFTAESYELFEAALKQQLSDLRSLLANPGFGAGLRSLGAEVELYLIDQQSRPVCQNTEVLQALPNAGLALEINRYNLEINLDPVSAKGRPLTQMAAQMRQRIKQINQVLVDAQVMTVGILPTLKPTDFGPEIITPENRYAVLARALRQLRGEAFDIYIAGDPDLKLQTEDVTLEGANTSLQLHVRVTPAEFANWFNAAQLVTPLVLGLSANSPLLFGHRLWHETRVPLFRQSIDGRSSEECQRALPSRVDLGSGWVREGVYELFSELVHLHRPILPIIESHQSPNDLSELRLHSGSVWPWNRAVYDPADGGHLRIELRALPAGPTVCDMLANAGLILGLTAAFAEQMPEWIERMPFETLSSNFYTAAEHGIEAEIYWPDSEGHAGLVKRDLIELIEELMPRVRDGLKQMGLLDDEIDTHLQPIYARIGSRQNGASWMRNQLDLLEQRYNQPQALTELVRRYTELSRSDLPVAQWPLSD